MGWSWALHFCQSVVKRAVEQVVGKDRVMQDRKPGIFSSSPSSVAGVAYVDNVAIISPCAKIADEYLDRVIDALSLWGLAIREVAKASSSLDFIGLSLRDGVVRVKTARLWKLRLAALEVIKRSQSADPPWRLYWGI